jgi:hypothetical protein
MHQGAGSLLEQACQPNMLSRPLLKAEWFEEGGSLSNFSKEEISS